MQEAIGDVQGYSIFRGSLGYLFNFEKFLTMHVHFDILRVCKQHVQFERGVGTVSPKMGQKIKENPKNIRLDLRLTKQEASDLQYCAEKLGTSRTDVINRGVKEVKIKLMQEQITDFINGFGGKYTLLDYGFSGDDYLKNGFWLKLKANFLPTINDFSIGKINFIINGNEIFVDRGYLNEIGQGLAMIR